MLEEAGRGVVGKEGLVMVGGNQDPVIRPSIYLR